MRHGYYLPDTGETFGDSTLSVVARLMWERCFDDVQPGRFDGVAAWRSDGITEARAIVHDLFAPGVFHILGPTGIGVG